MTTPYVDITDARIAANKPGDTGLFTDIRNDLRNLNERALMVGINSVDSIHDNFTGDSLNAGLPAASGADFPYTWDNGSGGVTGAVLDGTPDHWAHLTSSAIMAASKYCMRFDLDRDHTLYGEWRFQALQNDATVTWLMGFQDASKVVTAAASITTQDNIIAFVQDASAGKLKARTVKATVGLDVATALGTATNWQVLRIEITFAGATKKVEWFIDGVSVGSTTDTTKIPVVKMKPFFGFATGGRDYRIDYANFDWSVVPLST